MREKDCSERKKRTLRLVVYYGQIKEPHRNTHNALFTFSCHDQSFGVDEFFFRFDFQNSFFVFVFNLIAKSVSALDFDVSTKISNTATTTSTMEKNKTPNCLHTYVHSYLLMQMSTQISHFTETKYNVRSPMNRTQSICFLGFLVLFHFLSLSLSIATTHFRAHPN